VVVQLVLTVGVGLVTLILFSSYIGLSALVILGDLSSSLCLSIRKLDCW